MTQRPSADSSGAARLLQRAQSHERDGRLVQAADTYRRCITRAERAGASDILAEALRRSAVNSYLMNDPQGARRLCLRSATVAAEAGHRVLQAEAINTHATVDLQTGRLDDAQGRYQLALSIGGEDLTLRARLEQNLGILANIHGELDQAQVHYERALAAYQTANDPDGCAMAYHNLGMVNADRGLWEDASDYYEKSRAIAERIGDANLTGLCLTNQGDLEVQRGRFDRAVANAEAALRIFEQIGTHPAKVAAYRVIGMAYRETGRLELAEARLQSALDVAVNIGSVLGQAEATRERALLYRAMGRNQDALTDLNAAYRLFNRLDARVDLVNVTRSVEALESTYFTVVKGWGESLESKDSYTHGHCERVATYAVAVARQLGLDEDTVKTIRIGAYLHDVGKVRVPHEVLNKPSKLTDEEFRIIKMHPVWGVELLAEEDFPWDIKPIIRWHHEKLDGSGYPDRLSGDQIPISAQVIGIVDVYDALTTTRSYRNSLSRDVALAEIERCRHWWRADVVEAFQQAVGNSALPPHSVAVAPPSAPATPAAA